MSDLPIARRERAPGVPVVLTVGTDAAVGKRTAALELVRSDLGAQQVAAVLGRIEFGVVS